MFWDFKTIAAFVVVFLAVVAQSRADFQEFRTLFLTRKTVATTYSTVKSFSRMRCVEKCYDEKKQGRCNIAGYNKATETCSLSMDSEQNVVDTIDDSSGVFIFQQEPLAITQAPTCSLEIPLVNGLSPIPDDQMTASSEYDGNHGPRYARLHNLAGAGAWCPTWAERDAPTPSMYIQIQFMNVSAVFAIQTQGRPTFDRWVKTYRLEYSHDCATFNSLLNADGTNQTFTGNTDRNTIVENRLLASITALCIRLYPLTWNSNSCMRMEVLGCVPV